MTKKRKPVRGWRKTAIGCCDEAWSLRVGKVNLRLNHLGELSVHADVAEIGPDRVDAERWALVKLKDAWQRLAKKISEREAPKP